MLEVSEEITAYLLSLNVFTAVMSNRLSPLIANEGVDFPFTTYAIIEEPLSLDADEYTITLFLFFGKASYAKCADFTSKLKKEIKQEYNWLSSNVEVTEESLGFVGIINFKKQ